MFGYVFTTAKISAYMCWLYGCYSVGNKTRLECVTSTAVYLTSLNIVYSKIFQALSSGINFLSIEEMNYLSRYNDSAPYSQNEVYNIYDIVDKLNSNSSHKDVLFLKPGMSVNAGIISVVYYGRLGEKDVVIKVKRRGVREKLEDGIKLAEFIAYICNYIPYMNKLNLKTVVRENKDVLLKQTDFTIEIANMIEIKHKFRNVDYVTIPEPYECFTKINNDVIVMEQIKGYKRNDDEFDSNCELKKKFAILIAKFIVKSMFLDKTFHSDLHIGNVFFDNMCEDNLKLGIIDFGLVNKITKHMQTVFFNLFKHIVVNKDFVSASKLVLDVISPIHCSNKQLTPTEMQDIVDKIEPHVKGVFELCDNGCNSITSINNILLRYNRQLTSEFYNLYVSLVMSAGLCNGLCEKDTKFLHIVKDVIADMFASVEINTI